MGLGDPPIGVGATEVNNPTPTQGLDAHNRVDDRLTVLERNQTGDAVSIIVQTITNGDTSHAPSADAVFDALAGKVATPGAWTAPTYTGTWVNFGGSEANGAYRLEGDIVRLRGCIKSGTIGTSAFTLPAGHRPPVLLRFPVESAGAHGRVTVNTDGTVVPDVGSNTAIHLNTVTFSVTA